MRALRVQTERPRTHTHTKTGNILTGGGRLEALYKAPDFPWTEEQLPHYHKLRGDTHEVFAQWKKEGKTSNLVAGAWSRPLFVGGWQHTGDHTETVFNVQTPSLFIDLRIPYLPGIDLASKSSLDKLSDDELKLLARRHCFSGYSLLNAGPYSVSDARCAHGTTVTITKKQYTCYIIYNRAIFSEQRAGVYAAPLHRLELYWEAPSAPQ